MSKITTRVATSQVAEWFKSKTTLGWLAIMAAVALATWLAPDTLLKGAVFVTAIWAPLAAGIAAGVMIYMHTKTTEWVVRWVLIPAGLSACIGFIGLRLMDLDVKWFASQTPPVRFVDAVPTPAPLAVPGTVVSTVKPAAVAPAPAPAPVAAPPRGEAALTPRGVAPAPAPAPVAALPPEPKPTAAEPVKKPKEKKKRSKRKSVSSNDDPRALVDMF